MKTPSWRLACLGAAVVLVLLFLACALVLHEPKPPVYQGKNLYTWLTELQRAHQNFSDPQRWQKIQAATTAIRAMGTNALPFVMEDIRARVTLKDRIVYWLEPRAPFLKLRPRKVADRLVRGIGALEVLGPLAKPYLPELVSWVSNSTGFSESALVAVGPDAIPAFTNFLAHSKFPQTGNLIGAFANAIYAERITPDQGAVALPYLVRVFKSSDSHGRWYAASALGAIHQQPEICVPLLISGLTDSNSGTRSNCAESLGRFGDAAGAYAGTLAEVFGQTDPDTRRAICGALANYRSAAGIAVPVLVRGLQDQNESVRIWAATGLGRLDRLPEQAVPALAKAVEDPSQTVRVMAVQSLGQLTSAGTNASAIIQRVCLDPDETVRRAATNALIWLNSRNR